MDKIHTLPDPPSSWSQLTFPQLRYIFTLDRTRMTDIEYKMHVLLHLMNWKLIRRSDIHISDTTTPPTTISDLRRLRRQIQAAADRRSDIHIIVRDQPTGRLYTFTHRHLAHWSRRYMAFLDTPQGFTAIPQEHITHRRRRYLLPQPLLANLTYQQYTSCQSALDTLADTLRQPTPDPEELRRAKSQFLAHILTPRRITLLQKKDGHFTLNPRLLPTYDPDTAWNSTPRFDTAPDWLFRLLHTHFQGCLLHLRTLFPHLFTPPATTDTPAPTDTLLAELDTVNAVMKYQSYPDQQTVYDSNALFVLSILNTMTREAKEIKKITQKTKNK